MNKLLAFTLVLLAASHYVQAADLVIQEWEQARFNEIDANNDQGLDNIEFRDTTRDWMTKAGYSEEKQRKNTNKKFRSYDSNHDNIVSLEEFVTAMQKSAAVKKSAALNTSPASDTPVAKTPKNNPPAYKTSNSVLTIGDVAPNYLGTDTNGDEVNIDELKGKIVVVSFWVSWCKPCKNELSTLQNLQNKVGNDLLEVVAINYKESHRSYNKLKAQLAELNLTLTHDKRGKIGKKYGVEKAPNLFIIGKTGKVLFIDSKYNKTPINAIIDVLKKELST
ncbi:redoxin domain-containing protein [Colwellia piezophila]|uniref:redoxin domain-containing protein n=1 Tax=Colwellia piezophila TaxID=211668 RepID=UPI001469EC2E|nr:redoxin domain-containing protein [Colwellia piezophila]